MLSDLDSLALYVKAGFRLDLYPVPADFVAVQARLHAKGA